MRKKGKKKKTKPSTSKKDERVNVITHIYIYIYIVYIYIFITSLSSLFSLLPLLSLSLHIFIVEQFTAGEETRVLKSFRNIARDY